MGWVGYDPIKAKKYGKWNGIVVVENALAYVAFRNIKNILSEESVLPSKK